MNEYDSRESHRYAGNLGGLYVQATWMQTQARQLATMAAIRLLARALFRVALPVIGLVRRWTSLLAGARTAQARHGGAAQPPGRSIRRSG